MKIDANGLDFRTLNLALRDAEQPCEITGCLGQRFIAAGMSGKNITISGIPGNALGAYLDGGRITVCGNAQDAVGDTMNDGRIVIHGNAGDAVGYAMRGGEIYIRGNAGYLAGIHIKSYKQKQPAIIIGGRAGSFLGEYQAGGLILVLGLNTDGRPPVSNFPCTGMHGGMMVVRGDAAEIRFPGQTTTHTATDSDMERVIPYIKEFCSLFSYPTDKLLDCQYTVICPDSNNPYKQMYVAD